MKPLLAKYWPVTIICGMLLFAGCSKPERVEEPAGNGGFFREKSRFFLISRDATETISREEYLETIQAASKQELLDANAEEIALLHKVAEPIIAQAAKIYPHTRNWQWEYHVISNSSVNASCYPGGKIAVFSGLLKKIEHNPHKLAAVLGHEVSHALLEHGRAGISRDWVLSSSMWIVAKSFKMGLIRSGMILNELSLTLRPMGRNQEREADTLGLELMARADFNPTQGAQIWADFLRDDIKESISAQRLNAFTSSHPSHAERLQVLAKLAEKAQALRPGKQNR